MSAPAQAAAGVEYISLIIMAPSGTALVATDSGVGRFALSHSCISGEYQISTGTCVPKYLPLHLPSRNVPIHGPASRMRLSRTQPPLVLRWHIAPRYWLSLPS